VQVVSKPVRAGHMVSQHQAGSSLQVHNLEPFGVARQTSASLHRTVPPQPSDRSTHSYTSPLTTSSSNAAVGDGQETAHPRTTAHRTKTRNTSAYGARTARAPQAIPARERGRRTGAYIARFITSRNSSGSTNWVTRATSRPSGP
jgi:hypothetical protein